MEWNNQDSKEWTKNITNYDEKLKVAQKVASFVKDGDVIGFGSGSTSYLAVKEIAKKIHTENLNITAIPTSNEIRMECIELDIPVKELNDVKPDWGFDGADEVDKNNWLIKGRGGAMFNEKLVMQNSPKTYILVDDSKFVNNLCEKFPIPVECIKESYKSVEKQLYALGAKKIEIRSAGEAKDGPVITENGNYILDCVFENVTENLERDIKEIVGVLESGLFIGYNVEILN